MAAFVPSVARSAARSALRSGARRTAALSNCGATRAFSGTWDDVPSAPQDAIFGLTLAFNADPNPSKVNLGVGAYRDDDGKPYVLPCVREAERRIYEDAMNHEYATIAGVPEFVKLSSKLTFGEDHPVMKENRVAAVQTVSGTGALRTAAEFITAWRGDGVEMHVPNPTWGNHPPVFDKARMNVKRYEYYDAENISLDFSGMCDSLMAIPDGSAVLFQACAMNPTGVDPTPDQWREISALLKEKDVYIVFDNAYQGFASGDATRDAFSIRHFAEEGHQIIVCQSYSKNFGLYGHRVGVCSVVASDSDHAAAIESQLKKVVRPMYSNPPIHGARLVQRVLEDPELEAMWRTDCANLSTRINSMRTELRAACEATGSTRDWSHITSQIGMFSFTGLNPEQVKRMTDEFSIYLTNDGRISVAGINSSNVKYVANALHEVTK